MTIGSPLLPWRWVDQIVHDLGIAVIVASLLGFSIDRWLKAEIVEDVFRAALGYILPQEFKEEVRRITSFKFLCEKHCLHAKIEILDGDKVRLTTMVERTLRNITSNVEAVRGFYSVDEWGFSEGPSQILECQLELDGGETISKFEVTSDREKVTARTSEVLLRPGQSAKVSYKSVEIKRINDEASFNFRAPTKNPEIEITLPDSLECSYGFPGPDDRIHKTKFMRRYTLQGMYFPYQRMTVRWWPKAAG